MRTASLLHPLEALGHELRRSAPRVFGVAFEDRVDLGVGHARGRADDAFDDLEALDAARGVELHDAAEDEAVFVGAQAADVGRELLRQHGNGAIGEVDAGAAQAGFEIEGRAGADVLGHVGDVDLELIAAIGALGDQHRVVEVARGLAVDGDDGQGAEICAAGGFVRVEMGDGARLGQHVSGKMRGNWCLRIIISTSTPKSSERPEHFDDAANGRTRGRGPTGDLDIDDQALRASRFWTRVPHCQERDAAWSFPTLPYPLPRIRKEWGTERQREGSPRREG